MDSEQYITIKRETFYEMVYHCIQEKPLSARGVLAGAAAAHMLEKLVSVDPGAEDATGETIGVMQMKSRLQGRGLKALAHFRSHPLGGAEPTKYEIESFSDPAVHLIVVSLQDSGVPMVKAYSIAGSRVCRIRIEIE